MNEGYFVVIEGPEGAGKTTLVAALAEQFRAHGVDPLLVREPGGTVLAERIRGLLLDSEAAVEPVSELFLFLAARADLVATVVRPALEAGRVILADRFELSTEAYQCGGRGVDPALFREANRAATGGLRADLTLVLDLPPEQGLERIRRSGQDFDRIERSGPDFHGRVARVFRNATGPGIVHLDASEPSEQVLRSAWREVGVMRAGAPPAGKR
jgi:dTMP kinase